ncbi:MAG: polysulfide reductase NrfD [Gammaproteobacteria bacterium]|nr:polysulfide reductase NrfD [Gammaproteobacteria bacterium]
MKKINYLEIEGRSSGFIALLGILGIIALAGIGAFIYMEHSGHHVTGMDNQIVWGMPHVFAIFLIVAASGALNVASIGTVFNKAIYKPLGRLSVLMAIALLAGGLMVLLLDLGRPDRLIVAMTYYNFKSIFAWNIILYNGFFAVTIVYLWMMMEKRMVPYYRPAGIAAFIWRLILTTGTGSIFGFLVARSAFDAAIMAPMFIIMSFSFGLAIFLLILMLGYQWTERPLGDAIVKRLKNLLGIFVAAVLYFTLAYHLTNLYATEHHDVEKFILAGDSIHTTLFWIVEILIGGIIPLAIIYSKFSTSRTWLGLATIMIIIGGLAKIYVIVIGGQAFPLEIFPGMEVISSTFGDANSYHIYNPSTPEFILGISGVAVAILIITMGVRVLKFMPESLADADVDPHNKG